ncbi:MAG: hypothetical protein K8U57_07545 [Planctomycetes bacterium]|nr:hypothetical protein [Planctomycetota bacterium]
MTVKMQGPKGHGGLSHAGVSYEPGEDGIIEIPHEAVEPAMDHGFTVVSENTEGQGAGDGDLTKMKKADLLAFAKTQLGLDLDAALTNKQLIAAIEAAQTAPASNQSPAEGQGAGDGAA